MTCEATHSAISSPASADGAQPCVLQDGPMTDLSGRGLVPASRSAWQDSGAAFPISATCGLSFSASSASVALQAFLANRLPALLDTHGGIMWRLTWRAQTTPLRRQICRLQASVDRTHERASTGWLPTPRASMGAHTVCWRRAESGDHRSQLEDYLASLYLAAGGNRIVGANVDPLLCATMMGYPRSWLDSAMPSCQSLRPAL